MALTSAWVYLLTGCAGSVLLDVSSLLDELVLGGGETALDGGADGGRAELGGQARGGAEDLSLENHGGWAGFVSGSVLRRGEFSSRGLLPGLRLFWRSPRTGGMRSGLGKLRLAWLGYSSAKSGMNQAIC